jgi:hypothetical protein
MQNHVTVVLASFSARRILLPLCMNVSSVLIVVYHKELTHVYSTISTQKSKYYNNNLRNYFLRHKRKHTSVNKYFKICNINKHTIFFSPFHRAFLFTIFICSNKCTFFITTPIWVNKLQHTEHVKLINVCCRHEYHMKILSDFNKVQVTPSRWSVVIETCRSF